MKKRLLIIVLLWFFTNLLSAQTQNENCNNFKEIVLKDVKKGNLHIEVSHLYAVKGRDTLFYDNRFDYIWPTTEKLLLHYHNLKIVDGVIFDTVRNQRCYTQLAVDYLESIKSLSLDSIIDKSIALVYENRGSIPPYIMDNEKFNEAIFRKGFSLSQSKKMNRRMSVYFQVSKKGKTSEFWVFTGNGVEVPLNKDKKLNKRVRKLKKIY